jgi:hypothetical protein
MTLVFPDQRIILPSSNMSRDTYCLKLAGGLIYQDLLKSEDPAMFRSCEDWREYRIQHEIG